MFVIEDCGEVALGLESKKYGYTALGIKAEISVCDLDNGYQLVFINSVIKTVILCDGGCGRHAYFVTSGYNTLDMAEDTSEYNNIINSRDLLVDEEELIETIKSEVLTMLAKGGYNDSTTKEVELFKNNS